MNTKKRKRNPVNGWINLDKPVGLSSTQAMAKVRWLMNAQKAGHAGTLDPLASGILPIALGEATKTIPFAQNTLKTYEFAILWGETRDTDDAEGAVIATSDKRPSAEEIKALLPKYTGYIQQTPPQFSAIKINGERAYDIARAGGAVDLKPREVYVESLNISPSPAAPPARSPLPIGERVGVRGERLMGTETAFIMTCGPGTYVRSLARDLAKDLNTCGHISALRRTRVGPFNAENAISLDKLAEIGVNAALDQAILPLETALDDIPALAVRADEMARLKSGQSLNLIARPDVDRLMNAGLVINSNVKEALAVCDGKPVAIVEVSSVIVKPVRVFNI
jgi:tRNA pseudouridine55 synthase